MLDCDEDLILAVLLPPAVWSNCKDAIVRRTQQLLAEGFVEAVTLDRLSTALDISPRTLTRSFTAETEIASGLPMSVADRGSTLR